MINVNAMNQNYSALKNANLYRIVLAVSHVTMERVVQNVVLDHVHQDNYVKKMFALMVAAQIMIVQMIYHALVESAKIHARKMYAVKKRYADHQIIVQFVYVLMDSAANQQSNALSSNVKQTRIAIWIRNA